MAKVMLLLLSIIALQRCSNAAPNEPSKNTHPITNAGVEEVKTLKSESKNAKNPTTKDDIASQSQRQKRFYDYTEFEYSPYDLPAFSYPSQPHNSKRDDSRNTAVYGTEDPLNLIFKRLHEIVRDVRYKNVARPTYTPIPAYIPFLYLPPFDCGCTSNQGPAPPVNKPKPQPPTSSKKPIEGIQTTTNSSVTFDNRGGFDDKRQNWGVVTSNPKDVMPVGDGSRPINFDPIPPEEPMEIPVPPVDHGTVQAGAGTAQNNIITPQREQNYPTSSYDQQRPGVILELPTTSSKNLAPSLCDGSILSCCNKGPTTEKCFESYGCEDPTIYGDPCDPKVQLMVINKFKHFYERRSG